jgi:hypothetical protein
MKTITKIIGGAQGLLPISFKLQDVFEEYLDNSYRTFLHILRVMEAALPPFVRGYAGTGRKPYPYQPFIDPNNRGSETRPPLDPAKKERFKMRTEVERANSILKDWLLPRKLYY